MFKSTKMKRALLVWGCVFAWVHLATGVNETQAQSTIHVTQVPASPSKSSAQTDSSLTNPSDAPTKGRGHYGQAAQTKRHNRQLMRKYRGKSMRKGTKKGNGKGMMKNMSRGKSGRESGKGGSGGKGMNKGKKKKGNHEPDICATLELGSSDHGVTHPQSIFSMFKSEKGKGRKRILQACAFDAFRLVARNLDASIFFELLEATGLEGALECSGPFTVLAPSNVAFQKNPDLLKSLFNPRNAEVVRDMLLHHFVPEYLLAKDFSAGPLDSLLGPIIDVTRNPLAFNQAGVSDADLIACNAVVHILDDPLIPRDSPVLPEICEILDFRRPGQFPLPGKFNGIFNRRDLLAKRIEVRNRHRSLQFIGERCDNDILDVIRQDPDLATFESLLEDADLLDIFQCAGPFTILAPTNSAFAGLDATLLETLGQPENQILLQEVLLYHMLPEYQPSRSFQAGPTDTLLLDNDVFVRLDPLAFDQAQVVNPDSIACNGVVHSIDDVLSPRDVGPGECEALTFTNRRRLQEPDCDTNILDTARNITELSTVVSLIEAAELEYIFDCAGPFTALLPNNDAFDKLSDADMVYLADPANLEELQNLLLYHILPNMTMSGDFMPGMEETLSGDEVQVRLFPFRFDDARVVTQDIDGCNGLIDIIDTVLTPFELPTSPPSPSPTSPPTPMDICEVYTFNRRARALQNGGRDCTSNVLETARANDDLQVVTELISFAGLEGIFACAGPFTALLPTNSVFETLEENRPDFLQSLAVDRDALRNFLLYHFLPGAQRLNQFAPGPLDTLLDGSQVGVTTGPLQFDWKGVVTGDIQACNGFIHIISGILDPNAPDPTPAPVTSTPTLAPTFSPTRKPTFSPSEAGPMATPVQRQRIRDFYISYVNPDATREPTEEEYNEMMIRTNQWFSDGFEKFYENNTETTFLRAESQIERTLYGADAGIPEARFNIYIDFSFTDIIYTEDSKVPPTEETFDLLEDQIVADYILKQVRTYTETPFARVNEVWFAASERDVP